MKTDFAEKNISQLFFEDIENLINEMPKINNPYYSNETQIFECIEDASKNLNGVTEAISFKIYWLQFIRKNSHLLNRNRKAFSEYIFRIGKNIENAMEKSFVANENGINHFHKNIFAWKYNEIRNSFLEK